MPAFPVGRCHRRRRGAVGVFVVITLPVMLAFAALSIDTGYLYIARAELQNAADAASLAGASVYWTDAALAEDYAELTLMATQRAKTVASKNSVLRKALVLADEDILLGQHDFANRTAPLSPLPRWNAVQVTTRRTEASANGPVPFFFAGMFGRHWGNVIASARAVADDRMAGFRVRYYPGFLPFTIREDLYRSFVETGPDVYSYDDGVLVSPDGVHEVKLFPWKDMNTEEIGPDGAGNFGTLAIGPGGNSTTTLTAQITNGISADDLQHSFDTPTLVFYDAEHTVETGPRIYNAFGNPGVSTAIGNALEPRVGEIIGFFLHRTVTMSGSNAVYGICGVGFGRIMAVEMTGKITRRALVVQPVPYDGSGIITSWYGRDTTGTVGHTYLVQ